VAHGYTVAREHSRSVIVESFLEATIIACWW